MKSIISPLSDRFDHPLFASLFITAGLFVVIGLVLDLMGWSTVTAGFFGVYAIIATIFGVLGYGGTYFVKYVSQLREDVAPTAEGAEN